VASESEAVASPERERPGGDLGPVVELHQRDVDRSLIRRNLALSHEERFLQLMELRRLADELRRAGREARNR
jgi:hypothetical protein